MIDCCTHFTFSSFTGADKTAFIFRHILTYFQFLLYLWLFGFRHLLVNERKVKLFKKVE